MNTSLSSNAYNLETLPPYAFPLNTHLNKGYRGNTTAINPSTSQQQTTIGGGTVINNILIIPFATENSKVDKWFTSLKKSFKDLGGSISNFSTIS